MTAGATYEFLHAIRTQKDQMKIAEIYQKKQDEMSISEMFTLTKDECDFITKKVNQIKEDEYKLKEAIINETVKVDFMHLACLYGHELLANFLQQEGYGEKMASNKMLPCHFMMLSDNSANVEKRCWPYRRNYLPEHKKPFPVFGDTNTRY